jgi:hypothetical protein
MTNSRDTERSHSGLIEAPRKNLSGYAVSRTWFEPSTSRIHVQSFCYNDISVSLLFFLNRSLRMITDTPWYVPNTVIWKDIQIPRVKHEISRYSYHCSKRLSVHANELILNLQEPPETWRLRKDLPIDLPARFNM